MSPLPIPGAAPADILSENDHRRPIPLKKAIEAARRRRFSSPSGGEHGHDGRADGAAGSAVPRLQPGRARPCRSPAAFGRPPRRVGCGPAPTRTVLQRDRNGLEGRPQQLVVVAIGAVDGRPERGAATVGQHQALHPRLPRSAGLRPVFPHPAAPRPSPRPVPARSIRCPAGRRRPADPRARTLRTRRLLPTPESADVPRRTSGSSSRAAHSTDTPSAGRRRSRPSPPCPALAGCGNPAGAAVVAAARAPSWPRARPATASRRPERTASLLSVSSPSASRVDGGPGTSFLPGSAPALRSAGRQRRYSGAGVGFSTRGPRAQTKLAASFGSPWPR